MFERTGHWSVARVVYGTFRHSLTRGKQAVLFVYTKNESKFKNYIYHIGVVLVDLN